MKLIDTAGDVHIYIYKRLHACLFGLPGFSNFSQKETSNFLLFSLGSWEGLLLYAYCIVVISASLMHLL